MENTNDNFDAKAEALWNDFKRSVRKARTGERDAIYTGNDMDPMERLAMGGRVSVSKGDEDGTMIHMGRNSWSGSLTVTAVELRTIAAHCLAAAEEIEEAKAEAVAVRPSTSVAA